jgi:MFS family permease
MAIIKGLSGVINLRPEEQKSFRSLFLLSLITGIGLSYYFVAVNTFLIQKASVSNLPYAYIISGLGGVLLIKIYQHRQQKRGIINSYRESVIAFFIVAASVFIAFSYLGDNKNYAVFIAYLGFLFNMPFTIIFALSFSGICARLYNMAQSKRLLALVGTGEIIASIIGYLTAPLISNLTGSPNYLLILSSACIIPALIPIYKLSKDNNEKLSHITIAKTALKKLNISFFSNDKFYMLIAIVSVFSVSAIYFVDYSYLVSVRFMSAYSGIEIATIVGFFFSVVKIGELVFSFLSGHILSSKGVKFSILLLPVLLTSCFVLSILGSLLFQGEPIFILSFIFLAKFGERVIRKAISTPAIKVLYQVTGPDRLRIEATIEGVLNQVATVISGLLLLLFSALFSGSEHLFFLGIISGVCFVLFLTWTLLSLKLHINYKEKIWKYLTEIRSDKSYKRNEYDLKNSKDLPKIIPSENNDPVIVALNKALSSISEFKVKGDINQLIRYSPRVLSHIDSDDKDHLNSKIISSYYATDNFFHRLLVIYYLSGSGQKFPLKLVKEFSEISDLELRYELLKAYNTNSAKTELSELFYFENLCEYYSNELILVMSAQFDLQEIDDSELQSQLKSYNYMLVKVLFELLKVLYDPSAIQVIYDIITNDDNQDIENRLFALELLDNTLNEQLKNRLIPIFEPAPFDQKISKLQQFVSVHSESKEKKLKQFLMKDFILVNPALREACLVAFYEITNDSTVLNAFYSSKIRNLHSKASQLLNNDDRSIKDTMLSDLKTKYKLTSLQCAYLFNQAIQTHGSKSDRVMGSSKASITNPYLVDMGPLYGNLIIDTYALAIFIDYNQSGA